MIADISFDDARDVTSIRYRLHPLDVGFDLITEGMSVQIDANEDPLRVSYAGDDGERRVMEGPRAEVCNRLRAIGFDVVEVAA